jgi:hypothetical protein
MSGGPHWWGRFHVPLHGAARWQIGPLHLVVRRQPWAWSFSTHAAGPWDADHLEVATPLDPQTPDPQGSTVSRFSFGETLDPLELEPRLPDRTVVASPAAQMGVMPGEDCRAFVSVPLWVCLRVGTDRKPAMELPIKRPPDTWLGPSPMHGQLCYGSRAPLQLEVERLPHHPHRAIVPLRLRNEGLGTFRLERIRMPVPQLPLLLAADGRLWTPPVAVNIERSGAVAVELSAAPPIEAGPCAALSPAREEGRGLGRVMHSLVAMFGR